MFEAAPTIVGTSSVTANVRAFKLQLVDARYALFGGKFFSIAPNEALFVLSASVDGLSDYVVANNSTAIDYYFVPAGVGTCPTSANECLVNRSFSIEYTDEFGDFWELDIEAATWAP